MGPKQNQADYAHTKDLPGGAFNNITTADACGALCCANPACMAYTHLDNTNPNTGQRNMCYLKSTNTPLSQSAGSTWMTTAAKVSAPAPR